MFLFLACRVAVSDYVSYLPSSSLYARITLTLKIEASGGLLSATLSVSL